MRFHNYPFWIESSIRFLIRDGFTAAELHVLTSTTITHRANDIFAAR